MVSNYKMKPKKMKLVAQLFYYILSLININLYSLPVTYCIGKQKEF